MRHPQFFILCVAGALVLAGCENPGVRDAEQAQEAVLAIDEANLNGLMLNSTDPAEAAAYFRSASAKKLPRP